jgi:hypothetical protein
MQSPERISDATPRIVAEQFRRFQPLDELPAQSVLALDGEQDIDAQVARVTRAVDERMRTVASPRPSQSQSPCFPPAGRGVYPVVGRASQRLA